MEEQKKIMTYYWKKAICGQGEDEIVARSYETGRGTVFECGTAFEHRDPVTGLQRFFATRSSRCENKRDLKHEEERLRRLHQNTEIYTTEEPYR